MNIVIITPRYPYKDKMDFVFVKNLVDKWAEMGHRCSVISPFPWLTYLRRRVTFAPSFDRYLVKGEYSVEVYRPRYFEIPFGAINGVKIERISERKSVERIIASKQIKPDFVYAHFFGSATLLWHYANKNQIPFFVATGESEIPNLIPAHKDFTIDKFKNAINGAICVSSKNLTEASALGYIDNTKSKVFPNGTDLNIFNKRDRIECRKLLNLDIDAFIVIFVGYFINRKGTLRVSNALKRIDNPRIKAIFIGKGEESPDYDGVLYKGTVTHEKLPLYLNAADVFVLPTLQEGCCNAIVEAMACGLPIVSSDLPFNYDVLSSDNALMINPNDEEAIANAIMTLFSDKERCKRMGDKSLQKAQELSLDNRAEGILKYIKENI